MGKRKIGLHYNTCSGGTPSRTHEEYYADGTIPWVKTGEIKDNIIIHTDECITEDGVKGSSAKLLPQGAVVMAMYGVNIGMLAYLDSEMTCNQACCVFSDKMKLSLDTICFIIFIQFVIICCSLDLVLHSRI